MLSTLSPVSLPVGKFPSPPTTFQRRRNSYYSPTLTDHKHLVPKFVHRLQQAKAANNEPTMHEEKSLLFPESLKPEFMPMHVAIIMDGNRRWGNKHGLAVNESHSSSTKVLIQLARLCGNWGIKVLSVFAFSTENWSRPREEVDCLIRLLGESLKFDIDELRRLHVKISIIGSKSSFSKPLQTLIKKVENLTKGNTGVHLIICFNYSGKYDMLQATKKIAKEVRYGRIDLEHINESLFEQQLETNCCPEFACPDLLIRTSGEKRISNYMLWQLAYTELYFTETLFPEFGEEEFIKALQEFQNRQRRYGGQSY